MSQQEKFNHLNLSGLGIPKEAMMELASILVESGNLMGVHLSDNGIN